MKRDWELIRAILMAASEIRAGEKLLHTEIDGYFPMHVGGHIADLCDTGFLKAFVVRAHGYVMWASVSAVTREGLILLDRLNRGLVKAS